MPRFEGFKGEKLIIEMLLSWDKDFTKHSQAKPKRELARKLLELGKELPHQKIDFEKLARELDINGIQLIYKLLSLEGISFFFVAPLL